MAINRIIVEEPLVEEFTGRFVERVRALAVGDPAGPDTAIGPIINPRQLDGLKAKVARAKEEGARILLGGEPDGNVMPPHVFGDVTADMDIAREEIFGPLVGIQSARDAAHALELANDSEYGLSSAVFTGDVARGIEFARRVRAGMTHVNDMPVNDEATRLSAERGIRASDASTATGRSTSSPRSSGSPCRPGRGLIRCEVRPADLPVQNFA